MVDFRYGPVELYLVGFAGDRPDPGAITALLELVESGVVRLLDFVLVTKDLAGDVILTEIEDDEDGFGFGELVLDGAGLTGEEDVAELAELVEPGSSAAVIALELVFARTLATRLAAGGGVVLATERIPAPVVNALVDAVDEIEGE
ncbi:DUF6325 family protein [Microbacterium sp. X-17]|uniref:DUF6325 family protein n=1 Tax=Microbacterium sp. X-17 TaxID=3144404 RepID=UPI0031F5B3DB